MRDVDVRCVPLTVPELIGPKPERVSKLCFSTSAGVQIVLGVLQGLGATFPLASSAPFRSQSNR
jgi:hypothetical protein